MTMGYYEVSFNEHAPMTRASNDVATRMAEQGIGPNIGDRTMPTRTFIHRYANWAPKTVSIDAKLLEGLTADVLVRKVVGHAFMEQLKGDWQDGPNLVVVLEKSNPGVWIGRREKPQDKAAKAEPWYVLEL